MSSFIQQEQPLILASGSKIRAELLKQLGLTFSVHPAQCDEQQLKERHQSASILELGFALASTKALEVSAQHPGQFIIAADQLCVVDGGILDKPLNHQRAVKHLQLLRGKKHEQLVCLCLAHNQKIIWQHHERAHLTLQNLSDETIERYLNHEQPYDSCGAYHFESQGKWLFKEVEGSEETILGLPLIPLMQALIEFKIVTI